MVGLLCEDQYVGPYTALVYRMEWGASPPENSVRLNHPVSYIRLTHVGENQCHGLRECVFAIQEFQEKDMTERLLPDIASNFYINSDGIVFEGRGFRGEAHRSPEYSYLKGKCIDFAYIGDFTYRDPSWDMMRPVINIIRYGIYNKIIKPNFKIVNLRS